MHCGTIIRSDLTRQKQILWASSEGGIVLRALVRLQPPDEIGNPAALPEHSTSSITSIMLMVDGGSGDYEC